MRARTRWRPGLPTGANRERITHGVDGDFAAELFSSGNEPVAGLFVGVAECEAGHAGVGFGAEEGGVKSRSHRQRHTDREREE